MSAHKRISQRWRLSLAWTVCVAALAVVGMRSWQMIFAEQPMRMTFSEALWVTEMDFSRYYAPGTPESRAVVERIVRKGPALGDRRYDGYVLYRRGLSESSDGSESLVFVDFDPATVPRDRIVSTQ